MSKNTYSVVVESGSCSMDRVRWEETCHCGHAHRTIEAAERCLASLTKRDANGNCSAQWWGATIHNADGSQAKPIDIK